MNLDHIIDPDKLRELRELGDGDDFLLDILKRYVEQSREQLRQARTAFAARDSAVMVDIVHSWKGATVALGLRSLSKRLTEFTARLKDGEQSGAEESFDDLENELKEIERLHATIGETGGA